MTDPTSNPPSPQAPPVDPVDPVVPVELVGSLEIPPELVVSPESLEVQSTQLVGWSPVPALAEVSLGAPLESVASVTAAGSDPAHPTTPIAPKMLEIKAWR